MAKICFEIEVDTETGEVMAGVCPPDEENGAEDMAADKAYLQPVATMGEALGLAHDALMTEHAKGEDKMARGAEIRKGYDRAKGNNMPGMMGGMER
jgi:hypothetical protein